MSINSSQLTRPVADDLSVSMELDSTEMMKRFVLAGLGVTFLAVSNCTEEIAAGIRSREMETIFKICEHLSANSGRNMEKSSGTTPFDASYRIT